jgi:hypothetical protein
MNSNKPILMTRKILYLTIVGTVFLTGELIAQVGAILPTSGFVGNSKISLVFSAGETVVGDFSGSSMSLTGTPVVDVTVVPTSTTEELGLPKSISLNQNYPNPFNPATIIPFELDKSSDVQLEIFNTIGMKVLTLIDGRRNAGYHTVKFDARNLASGMYFYRLIANGRLISTRKMMLIK